MPTRRYVIEMETSVRITNSENNTISSFGVTGSVAVDIRSKEIPEMVDQKLAELTNHAGDHAKLIFDVEKARTAQ